MKSLLTVKCADQRSVLSAICLGLLAISTLAIAGQGAPAQPAVAQAGSQTPPRRHKVKVSDPALAQGIATQGGRLIADYGGYQLYDAPEGAGGWKTNSQAEIHDEYNFVQLNARQLDTTKPEIKSLRKAVAGFSGKRMHLIHFAGPILPQWREDLLATGVQIISYVPENAYLVYGDASGLAKVQALAATSPQIQWEGAYSDSYKIHPKARTTDEKGKLRNVGTDMFAIQLVADEEANTNTLNLIEQLKLEKLPPQHAVMHYLNVIARLDPATLDRIAARPEVVSIQPYFAPKPFCERQDQIVAGNLTNNVPTGPGYLAWLASKGFTQAQFTASGFAVDISDSGVDEGTTSPAHFGLHVNGNLAAASRVVYARLESTTNDAFTTLAGCDGHGTLNAHIVGGYDNRSGFPFADTNGYHYGLGVCPFVNLGSSVIFNPDNIPMTFNYPNYKKLQADAYHGGARISNNSWGSSHSAGAYGVESQTYDALVRDAESAGSSYPVAGNQEMVIVFAAGNDGEGGFETVDAPATAKNVISVGAADNVQPFGGEDASGVGDDGSSSANEVIFFSSRGPCADGRTKPDIMAPGTHVSGGVAQWSQALPNPAGTGTAEPCLFNSLPEVSGGPGGDRFFPAGQQYYTASSGTSHAAPCVAGGCALVRQYFINHAQTPPSAAMTKAFLLNSARYLTGATANDTLPSQIQGMGEMNLGTAFDGTPRILRDQQAADLFTASGQSRTFTGTISDSSKPFRVTVAWTDAPGSTVGNAYNNNLDLSVTVGGNVYKGNVFNGQYSAPGGQADARNNVESVFLPAGTSGGFVVTINGTSINSVGVPNSANALEQDFALVIYNADNTPAPIIANAGTALVSESCSPANGAIDPGETVTVNLSLQNIGSVDGNNVVATLLTNSTIFPNGAQSQTYGALPAGGAAVSQPFTFAVNGPCGGTVMATLQLQDGGASIGTVSFPLTLGTFVPSTPYIQNFDAVSSPALPLNWDTQNSGAGLINWVTVSTNSDTPNNSAFVPDIGVRGVSDLISPTVPIASPTAQLSFRNSYNLENSPSKPIAAFDGGVLEMSIGGGAFLDITAQGGSFVSGGYNTFISADYNNPLVGRKAWSGNSGGYITTTVNLPAAAAGQYVTFRWRLATDDGNSILVSGWNIDSISIADGAFACCGSSADVGIQLTHSPAIATAGSNLVYTASIMNLGPDPATGVTFTDVLPAGLTFVSGSAGSVFDPIANSVSCNLGGLTSGSGTNVTVTVNLDPNFAGSLTNIVSVTSTTLDYNSANNQATNISTVNQKPFIITQPTNLVSTVTSNAAFFATAGGTGPLGYQWLFNGTNISGTNIIGATSNLLTLTNLALSQNGGYSLLVSNFVGSVTSVVATLTVLSLPKIPDIPTNSLANLTVGSQKVTLAIKSVPGMNYTLQYKDSLTDPNWISILPPVPGTGGVLILTDPAGAQPHRYYRAVSVAGP